MSKMTGGKEQASTRSKSRLKSIFNVDLIKNSLPSLSSRRGSSGSQSRLSAPTSCRVADQAQAERLQQKQKAKKMEHIKPMGEWTNLTLDTASHVSNYDKLEPICQT